MRPRATATPSHTSAQSRQSVLFAFGRNTSSRLRRGIMPLEIELPKVLSRPSVSFHLLPLANALQKANQTSKPTPNNTNKRKHEETQPTTPNAARPSKKGKGAGKGKSTRKGRGQMWSGKLLRPVMGRRICWAFNLQGCSEATAGGQCSRGGHVCAEPGCGKAHALSAHS